ncbi:glycosyltransferase family 4 protein [Lutibacter flavus]|uniref:Glycosyltransferase involved in cell wall bisynthesis n=1 Tax=Lutibacter flavus TaxID=691689 RepID=A0A238VRH8_9FLAO|nr:glycosyltransferase [Lutibacter flavus]SNR36960.1 Glycosyltransferase involved in cell wall bisynthesis [Lutibacter flavus]
MPKKLKILISAYACSPNRGSEPGMGWNFVIGLSKFHEVHVITETLKWKKEIEEHLAIFPEYKNNLNFYFIEKKRNKKLRKIWPPSYYWFYKKWQKNAYHLALELDKKVNFDIVHQLNMVGYREPGYLWKIDKPFVWGPIGGLENSPWSFLPSLGIKGLLFYTGRNIYNIIQRNFSKRAKQSAKRTKASLISATPGNNKLINDLWNNNSEIICEVGQEKQDIEIIATKRISTTEPLKIIWSGQHTPGKNLQLLLDALENVTVPYELHILGKGEMTNKWKKIAQNKGLSKYCNWYGWIERQKAIDIMSAGHVFCITSISDLTSTVTLEALSYGLPIVCLDHCGFAHVVNKTCGLKIPVTTPKKAIIGFKKAIETLYFDESLRQKLAEGALIRAQDFSWEGKIEKLNSIYTKLLSEDPTHT